MSTKYVQLVSKYIANMANGTNAKCYPHKSYLLHTFSVIRFSINFKQAWDVSDVRLDAAILQVCFITNKTLFIVPNARFSTEPETKKPLSGWLLVWQTTQQPTTK